MDFLDPAKKRQHKIRLLIGYFLICILVLTLSYLLILQTYGYDYDRHTGKIIQNGLVYLSSHPVSGDVYVNGIRKGNTNLKLTIPSGKYDFMIKSTGYRDWQTTVNLEGGSVEQLTYPLLIPQNLVSKAIKIYTKKVQLASVSLDRHWLLVQQPGSLVNYDILDLTKPAAAPKTITLPSNILTADSGSQSIKVIEWSSDNQHVLMQHSHTGGPEYFVLDRKNPAQSFNINSLLDVAPTNVVMRDKKYNLFYAYIAKTKSLLSINSSNQQVNTVLRNVLVYKAYGPNTILYTSNASKVEGKYSVNIWDGQKSRLLHTYQANSDYILNMASYNSQIYVAVCPLSSNRLYIFKNPLPVMQSGRVPNPFIALKIDNPKFVSFSGNARFVMAQSGANFAGYDFEKNLWHYFTLKDKVSASNKASWMDGHRLLLNINSRLNVFDFNGGNQQQLVNTLFDTNGFFNSNYSGLYTIGTSATNPKQFGIIRTSMIAVK